jgi:uncharacterized protein YndB with AHSA1/START domain
MSDYPVAHATFTLERTYPVPPARVFAAWAEPAAKAKWFAGSAPGHELDFRVGGREAARGVNGDGDPLAFESTYHDIVPASRIVYGSTMSVLGQVVTVSTTTVELSPVGEGTRLVLTEQGTYLDGREQPAWREQGTSDQLDALGAELKESAS